MVKGTPFGMGAALIVSVDVKLLKTIIVRLRGLSMPVGLEDLHVGRLDCYLVVRLSEL
jgi:hypothetical protein